ncbi:MAG: PAS domain S-box protein [Bacteroidota bacterium]
MEHESPSRQQKRIADLERRIEEYKDLLDRSQEIAHLGSWELDLIDNKLTWSDEVFRIFGLEPQEFGATYEAFLDRVHPDDREAVSKAYESSIKEGRDHYEIEHRVIRKNTGEIRYVHERCDHIRNSSGNIVKSIGMVQDITERVEREKIYEKILKTTIDGFWMIDSKGHFLEVNSSAAAMLGYTVKEMEGLTVNDIDVQESPEETRARMKKVREEGSVYFETQHRHKNGSLVDVDISVSYLPYHEGLYIVFTRNITERKRQEAERSITLQLLQHLHSQNDLHDLMSGITRLMQDWSGCEAVGIRLKRGEDYPYFETRGFPPEFVNLENSLCEVDTQGEYIRDSKGNPVLECMCGNVIRGRTDASLPFFTEYGSFWTHSTTELLGSTSEEDRQARTRNRCQGEGYETVVLIPLRYGSQTLGLLQFNDSRKNRFDEKQIELFEQLAKNLALGVVQNNTAEELQKSEEKFRALYENAPIGIFQTNSEGRALMINRAMAHILDFDTREEALDYYDDLSQQLYLNPETREKFLQLLKDEGKVENFEYAAKTVKGRQIWLTMSARVVKKNEDGAFVIEGFVSDITDRKLAEKGLIKSKNKFKALVEQSSEMLFLHDLDGWIIEFNRAARKNTGYGHRELASMNVLDIDPDAGNREDRKKYWQALSVNDDPVYFETRHQRKDGTIYPAEIVISKIVLEDQKYILALASDITERKQAEEKLRQTEARQSAMITNIADVLAISDKNGVIQYKSPNITRFFGWKPEDLVGKSGWVTVHPDDRERIEQQFNQILQKKNASTTMEYRYRCKDNTYTPVELTAINLLHDPNVKGILVNYHDVSRQKMVEEELRSAKEKAEESDRLKSAFLANMSHEIRTPMNGIMGFSQMLKEKEYPRDRQKQFLSIIYSRTQHLLQIINDLVDVSKIEAGQLTLDLQKFYLNDVFSHLYDIYKTELESREKVHVKLSVNMAFNRKNSIIKTDSSRFKQIMDNLLSNAVKFTQEGSIELGYELHAEGSLLFYVKDTGIGISNAQQKHIFERFRQADDSTIRVHEGTGLGLTISKNLVELMGGEMWVDSKEGEGSAFFFTLPCLTDDRRDEIKEQTYRDTEDYNWKGKTLLIIEDDPTSREYMQEILQPTGAGLIFAETGAEGLKKFEGETSIDVILLDIRLPDINGMEISRKIRKQNETIPIIAQTAHAMSDDRQKCIRAGANDYVSKPCDIQDLLSIINKYI